MLVLLKKWYDKVLKCFFWCHKKKKISYFLYTERQQTEWERGVCGEGGGAVCVGGGGGGGDGSCRTPNISFRHLPPGARMS